ncbi:TPA: restriction endonuclease subunit S [Vibrio parahaemolyticus]|uniref:restriction endonuclease subunit S n=1 Tax=Vibrio parahaemolyticus TaxID=670 RepID=UPI00035D9CB9|nr:restriction endonuclease subunit S [Vibrio parahaemolyticus]EJA7341149.1 restriction endonuclease subunit S [Vibrio parahaemolyticus]MBY3747969.1 restriction endonuclease subunit S [Vibrio parahaemolyticus]MBY3760120.1 restriction endonuclease subunit S [Vibrio parahaemolyticus]MBY3765628.1 restriction endonuclease subunit S [Vibrio parahaemolyticus]MBY3776395.1 restriction endonuclease subunit S [Vibrio parahaemolyticus]
MSAIQQQVPEGYKQTEVGFIPNEWKLKKFREVTSAITCGVAATPVYVSEQVGKPFLSAQNVRQGKVDYRKHKYISKQLFNQITKYNKPEKGDILYTRVGAGIGEAGVIEDDYEFAIYVSLTLIKPLKRLANPFFLSHLLNSDKYRYLAKNGQFAGGGVQNLNVDVVREFPVSLPHIEEQTAIANALSDVDALICELEKLIAKKQAIKTATMQQLLTGKKRLPQFAKNEDGTKKGYKKSELGDIPEDWQSLSLGSDAVLKARIGWQALTTKEYQISGDFFLVTGTDFDAGLVKWERCFHVSEWRYKQDTNIQLKEGDVLVTKDGTIGKVGYVPKLTKPATLNSGVFVIRPKRESFEPRFLFYILTSRLFDDFITRITAGSTITHLYQKDFVNFEFFAPEKSEQIAIATILSDMDSDIQALEQRLSKTRQIKQGMMQELLTGKTRLVKPESK